MDTAAQVIIHSLHPDINAIGGLTMGSDPIAAAVCVHWDIKWFSVRKQIKEHGLCERIVPSGVLPEGSKVTIVDDVITSGQSIIEAIRAVREASLEVIQVMALVDREMGGIDKIRAEAGQGVDVRAAFTLSEIRRAWERSKI
jgi:orotate phosphoribosyltransferase